MTNPNLRDTIRTAFQNSGLSVADFDNELSSTLDELYNEEKNATTCGADCMSLPWDSFFDNIIFPYITTQIPSCGSLSALRQEDDLYTTLRTETKNFFVSIGDVHSLFTNPKNEDTLNSLLSALIH